MNSLLLMIYLTAVAHGVEPRLAIAIAHTESRFKTGAIGKSGDTGLFQVRHQFVTESQDELLDPKVNTLVAMRLLKKAKRGCSSLGQYWPVCYNRGVSGGKRLVEPQFDDYYLKVSLTKMCLDGFSKRQIMSGKAKECFL